MSVGRIVSPSEIAITSEDIKNWQIRHRLKTDFSKLRKITDKWGFIRQVYMEHMPEIMKASRKDLRGQIDPYFIDWLLELTPIEDVAWDAIRCRGVPFYPQLPLFNFFVDFGNPHLRIGLELDGKEWHDTEKDLERDELLSYYGWKIFRVKGSETRTKYESPGELAERDAAPDERDRAIEHWLMNTCDGVVAAIDYVYFWQQPDKFEGLCMKSLQEHRLAKFALLARRGDDA